MSKVNYYKEKFLLLLPSFFTRKVINENSYIYIFYTSRIIYIILQFAFPPSVTEIFSKLLLIFIHLFIGHTTWLVGS